MNYYGIMIPLYSWTPHVRLPLHFSWDCNFWPGIFLFLVYFFSSTNYMFKCYKFIVVILKEIREFLKRFWFKSNINLQFFSFTFSFFSFVISFFIFYLVFTLKLFVAGKIQGLSCKIASNCGWNPSSYRSSCWIASMVG